MKQETEEPCLLPIENKGVYKTGTQNHYAIASFFPKLMTDKALFLFDKGRYWKDWEKEMYIGWVVYNQPPLLLDGIILNIDLKECRKLQKEDPYVDWVYCSLNGLRNLQRKNELPQKYEKYKELFSL